MLQATCLLAGAALAVAIAAPQGQSEQPTLKSPFARADALATVRVASRSRIKCDTPPAPVRDIVLDSKYGKDRRSHDSTVIDAADAAEYEDDTRPITQYSRRVAALADGFSAHDQTSARSAYCALAWLNHWAQQDALLGRVNPTGQSVRKWELATLASAYLKIRSAPHDAEQAARVRRWLGRLAEQVRSDYSRDLHLDSRSNNHLNWAAWAVMAGGIAADDSALFDWSVSRFRTTLARINNDGTLPLELKRRQLAAAYHGFALPPLIMLKEGTTANGIRLSPHEEAKLQKLVDVVLASWSNPGLLQARSGYQQDLSKLSASHLAWLEPYYARTRDPRVRPLLDQHRPLSFSRLGGNLTLLFGDIPRSTQAQSRPPTAKGKN